MSENRTMTINTGPLRVAVTTGVALVSIDNPPHNLVDHVFMVALAELLDRLEKDPDVRVVLFTSADPDFFLMHGDVRGILAAPQTGYRTATEANFAAATFQRLSQGDLVTIGAIDGVARGGGAEFVSALDIRIGSPHAVLGQPEVPMHILPGAGGTARLPRLLGRGRALEIILTARDVAAEEAAAVGWLDQLVPAAELSERAKALAARIARMPPQSIAAVKRVVNASIDDLGPALVAETDAYGRLTSEGGHRAPMEHFLELGGQTRDGERDPATFRGIVDDLIERYSG
jgi:enoyl-CoA hydratase/carnithine racemase